MRVSRISFMRIIMDFFFFLEVPQKVSEMKRDWECHKREENHLNAFWETLRNLL